MDGANNSGSGIGFSDAGVLALLADTNRAGGRGGGGVWGGGYGEGGGYGGGYGNIANAVRLDKNSDMAETRFASIERDFENGTRDRQMAALSGQISNGEFRSSDHQRSAELNSLRESADLSRQIAACCCENRVGLLEQALKMQECCCETQKLIQADGQKTRDLISENALREAVDKNNISATVGAINGNANANTNAIIAAIREGHHRG